MTEESNKDLAVLSLLADLTKLLENDPALASRVKEKLELAPLAGNVTRIIQNRRAKQTYYSERYALELKPTLDNMIKTHEHCQFLISEHPNLTVRTLYLKIYQPWQWLMDFHPDKDKYRQLKQETLTIQKPNHSVRIMFESEMTTLRPKQIDQALDLFSKLQNEITEFLSLPITQDALFDKKKCSLNDGQMADLKDSLAGIPSIVTIIEPSRVRIMRKFVEVK